LETKPEHILLNALGGRKSSIWLVCSECNNEFGRTIDATLAASVSVLRNTLQFPSGSGKPPPPLKKVPAGDRVLDFRSDGSPVLNSRPFKITREDDGYRIDVEARSPEHLKSLLPHIAVQVGLTAEQLRDVIATGNVRQGSNPSPPIDMNVTIGGEEAVRSITKSCLELAALSLGNDRLKEEPFDAARCFVKLGDPAFMETRTSFDTRLLPCEAQLAERFGPAFNSIFVRSDEQGRMLAHFTLYNMVAWHITLAGNGAPPNVALGLVSNPFVPSEWADDVGDQFCPNFGWLDHPVKDDVATALPPRMAKVLWHGKERVEERAVEREVRAVFARHGITDGEEVDDEAVREAVLKEAVWRAGHVLQRVPFELVIEGDEVMQWLTPDDGGSDAES
jgi:hypothetical protein